MASGAARKYCTVSAGLLRRLAALSSSPIAPLSAPPPPGDASAWPPAYTARLTGGTTRRPLVAAALTAVAILAAGCASIPTESEIREVREAVGEAPDLSVGVYARPPQPDARPADIVTGFLEASGAVNFEVVRQYLAPGVEWEPSTVVVYSDSVVNNEDQTFNATKIAELDERHAFRTSAGNRFEVAFALEQVDDQWRISDPPDQLLISEIDFELQYESYNRYYFEPTYKVLVPDPIHIRTADQDVLAARLVHSLLSGPTDWLAPAVVPVLPGGIQCESDPETCARDVTIEGGVATVKLTNGGEGLSAEDRGHLLAQVVWTLNELDVDEVSVVVDGLPVSGQRREVDAFSDVRPAGSGQITAVRRAYALNEGRLNTLVLDGDDPRQTAVGGPFAAAEAPPISAFAVATRGSVLAAVVAETQLFVFPEGAEEPGEPVLTGERLISPSWDRFGRLWIVDATADGSVVRVWDGEGAMQEVDVPDLDGVITQLAVSDDGTRVAMVVQGESEATAPPAAPPTATEVRVVRRAGGGVELANPRPLAPELAEVADVAWQDAGTLVVLGGQISPAAEEGPSVPPSSPLQPFLVSIDSSTVSPQGIAAEESVSVAATPSLPILVGTSQGRIFQYENGIWTDIGAGVSPGYPG